MSFKKGRTGQSVNKPRRQQRFDLCLSRRAQHPVGTHAFERGGGGGKSDGRRVCHSLGKRHGQRALEDISGRECVYDRRNRQRRHALGRLTGPPPCDAGWPKRHRRATDAQGQHRTAVEHRAADHCAAVELS